MLGSIWDLLLKPERYRQRAAPDGGFSVPMMMERDVELKQSPFLVTNTRGNFVPSPRGKDGKGRYGFFHCPVADEGNLLPLLQVNLETMARAPGWPTPAATVSEAVKRLVKPCSIILSDPLIATICGEGFTPDHVATLMKIQGHIAIVDGMQILAGALRPGSALVTVEPEDLGVYTRVGDYLGIQLFDVRRTIVVVRTSDGVAG